MSKALIEKLRRARESKVTVDGKSYTIRRPTDIEVWRLKEAGDDSDYTLATRFVVGWELVEMDFDRGGGPDAVPFDAALWTDWLADKPLMWGPIAKAVVDEYTRHAAANKAAEKNS